MRIRQICAALALVLVCEVAAAQNVAPAPITQQSPFPSRGPKEGWLTVDNHDWQPYYLSINPSSKRMSISKNPNGGFLINSGQSVTVAVIKHGYKLNGDTGMNLEVKIREGEATKLDLNPFGPQGNTGLLGVATARDKVRSEVLFANYAPPPVVVTPAPAPVVVTPAPAPVVVQPAPVVVAPPAPYYGSGISFEYYSGGGWGDYGGVSFWYY